MAAAATQCWWQSARRHMGTHGKASTSRTRRYRPGPACILWQVRLHHLAWERREVVMPLGSIHDGVPMACHIVGLSGSSACSASRVWWREIVGLPSVGGWGARGIGEGSEDARERAADLRGCCQSQFVEGYLGGPAIALLTHTIASARVPPPPPPPSAFSHSPDLGRAPSTRPRRRALRGVGECRFGGTYICGQTTDSALLRA